MMNPLRQGSRLASTILLVTLAHGSLRAQTSKKTPHPVIPQGMKLYTDPQTGVSFRYPAAWSSRNAGTYGGDPLDEEQGKDDARPPKLKLQVGWHSYSHFRENTDTVETYTEDVITFAYAVLPEPTAESCAARFVAWEQDGADNKPDTVTVNGIQFVHITHQDAGLGHSWSSDVYTTFQHGNCLGFSVGSDTVYGVDPHKMSKAAQAVSMDTGAVLKSVKIDTPAAHP